MTQMTQMDTLFLPRSSLMSDHWTDRTSCATTALTCVICAEIIFSAFEGAGLT
jgi:hypothetical protein